MAQKVEVRLTCDLDDEPTLASDTVVFAYDGRSYTFELCEKHLAEFNEVLGGWAANARRVAALNAAKNRTSRPSADKKAELAAIREWASHNGYEVSDRGRISGEVRREYEEALLGQRLIEDIEVDIAQQEPKRARRRRA